MNVTEWTELFAEIGLSDEQMQQWHGLFEAKYPEEHQRFLEWLQIDAPRIAEIRAGK